MKILTLLTPLLTTLMSLKEPRHSHPASFWTFQLAGQVLLKIPRAAKLAPRQAASSCGWSSGTPPWCCCSGCRSKRYDCQGRPGASCILRHLSWQAESRIGQWYCKVLMNRVGSVGQPLKFDQCPVSIRSRILQSQTVADSEHWSKLRSGDRKSGLSAELKILQGQWIDPSNLWDNNRP